MKNIYLVGKAGSGKTTCAKYLIEKYNYWPAKFAYPVYDIARNYFNMQDKDRNLLQIIGTNVGRILLDYNIWIKRFKEDMFIVEKTREEMKLEKQIYVLDDCRFINEDIALREMGWLGIYLYVSENTLKRRLSETYRNPYFECLDHISEREINYFKDNLASINADCSIEDMFNNLDKILNF